MSNGWIDWIFPIIIIVVSIAQWLGKSKKKTLSESMSPADTQSLDDLFEALGKRTGEAPPVIHKQPPPVASKKKMPPVAPRVEKTFSIAPPVAEEKHLTEMPKIESLPHEKELNKKAELAPRHEMTLSFREWMHHSSSLRQAIIVKEILATPMGLKSREEWQYS